MRPSNDVDVEGKLVVKDDASVNAHLSVLDASSERRGRGGKACREGRRVL